MIFEKKKTSLYLHLWDVYSFCTSACALHFFLFLFFDISPLPFWSNEGIELLM